MLSFLQCYENSLLSYVKLLIRNILKMKTGHSDFDSMIIR